MKRLEMEHRARPSGVVLVEADAAIVKGMLLRGDRQHDVAAWFGVSAGRIAEIAGVTKLWWYRLVRRRTCRCRARTSSAI